MSAQYTKEEELFILKMANDVTAGVISTRGGAERFIEQFGLARSSHGIMRKIRDTATFGVVPKEKKKHVAPEMVEDVNSWLSAVFNHVASKPPTEKQAKAVKSSKPSLVLMLSDLHYGKLVPETGFCADVADKRLASIPKRLSKFVGVVDEVVITCLGDLVEGVDVYSNQNIKLEFGAMLQTTRCVDGLGALILLIHGMFKCNVRVEFVYGNHGRTSKTASHQDNWDNVVAYVLSVVGSQSKSKRLSVRPSYEQTNILDIKGHSVLMRHRGVKHSGTPAKQIKMASWFRHHDADIILHGHWHRAGLNEWMDTIVVSNGSLCGVDEYGESIGAISPAKQVCFLLEDGRRWPYGVEFLDMG